MGVQPGLTCGLSPRCLCGVHEASGCTQMQRLGLGLGVWAGRGRQTGAVCGWWPLRPSSLWVSAAGCQEGTAGSLSSVQLMRQRASESGPSAGPPVGWVQGCPRPWLEAGPADSCRPWPPGLGSCCSLPTSASRRPPADSVGTPGWAWGVRRWATAALPIRSMETGQSGSPASGFSTNGDSRID